MSRIKDPIKKGILTKANKSSKRAPLWVIPKTNRKVRGSSKSGRSWRRSNLF